MVNYSGDLDLTFSALADPTRRAILATLSRGPASVTELARPHRISLPGIVKHLRVLELAGLVSAQKTGRVRECRLAVDPLKDASEWLAQYRVFWERQFDALDRYFTQSQPSEASPCPPSKSRRKRRSK